MIWCGGRRDKDDMRGPVVIHYEWKRKGDELSGNRLLQYLPQYYWGSPNTLISMHPGEEGLSALLSRGLDAWRPFAVTACRARGESPLHSPPPLAVPRARRGTLPPPSLSQQRSNQKPATPALPTAATALQWRLPFPFKTAFPLAPSPSQSSSSRSGSS